MKKHGLKGTQFKVQDAVLYTLIDDYTREAGVRELERMLAALCRKAVKELVSGTCKRVTITTNVSNGISTPPTDVHARPLTIPTVSCLLWSSGRYFLCPR